MGKVDDVEDGGKGGEERRSRAEIGAGTGKLGPVTAGGIGDRGSGVEGSLYGSGPGEQELQGTAHTHRQGPHKTTIISHCYRASFITDNVTHLHHLLPILLSSSTSLLY